MKKLPILLLLLTCSCHPQQLEIDKLENASFRLGVAAAINVHLRHVAETRDPYPLHPDEWTRKAWYIKTNNLPPL